MSGKRGNRAKETEVELNLVPIMGLLCVLIPVLLAAFNFFEIKVQALSVPRMATGKPKPKKNKAQKPLNLSIYIDDRSFVVDMQKEHKGAIPNFGDTITIPKKEFKVGGQIDLPNTTEKGASYYGKEERTITEYDYPTLYKWLALIKREVMAKKLVPKEPRTINISAKYEIPWRILARTIDAVRVRLAKDDFGTEADSLEQYSQSTPKKRPRVDKDSLEPITNEDGEPLMEDMPLFDAVVFTVPRS